MQYTKEMKIWLKQQRMGVLYCRTLIDGLRKQIKLHNRRIALELAQIREIERYVAKACKEWPKGK